LGKFDFKFYGKLFTIGEANVIAEIYNNRALSAKDISENLMMNKGQLSKMLNKFEKNGLVVRVPDNNDKRSFILSLTEKGTQMYLEQIEIVRLGLREELLPYSKQEMQRLDCAMTIFKNTYEKNNHIAIDEGTTQDIGFIADLHSRLYTELGYHYAIQTHILTSLIRYTEKPRSGKIWIAKVNGIRVGSIGIVENEKNKWEIHWFAVDSNYQHLGLGKQLLDTLMQFITEKQMQHVYLWTINELTQARNLYARSGFTLTEAVPTTKWKNKELMDEKWVWQHS
jgi:DNA-binding MarR family transcriptional regulator/N-acetylglutamate synthase-like GNAT family acetyltransferase